MLGCPSVSESLDSDLEGSHQSHEALLGVKLMFDPSIDAVDDDSGDSPKRIPYCGGICEYFDEIDGDSEVDDNDYFHDIEDLEDEVSLHSLHVSALASMDEDIENRECSEEVAKYMEKDDVEEDFFDCESDFVSGFVEVGASPDITSTAAKRRLLCCEKEKEKSLKQTMNSKLLVRKR